MFETIYSDGNLTVQSIALTLGAALLAGVVYAFLTCCLSRSTKSFFIATALLPMAVAMVIALVNGNIGTGVAIAGAFGLVRFRSAPGTAKEICTIFIEMAAGLAFGMGYIAYGALFLLICGILLFAADKIKLFENKPEAKEKTLRIVIPENLNYTEAFDDIFSKYTSSNELVQVKTTNMGSMFKLKYKIVMKNPKEEKNMIDEIRCRNGNLEIMSECAEYSQSEL